MTLGDLAEYINRQLKAMPSCGSAIVCIPNNKPQIGGTSVTNVSIAGIGCDWDKNRFMIYPEKPMIEKVG